MNKTIIKDALYNASNREIRSAEDVKYARGIVVGVVAGLMSKGMQFTDALKVIKECLPSDYNQNSFPMSWRD